jgi:hypothetical protein
MTRRGLLRFLPEWMFGLSRRAECLPPGFERRRHRRDGHWARGIASNCRRRSWSIIAGSHRRRLSPPALPAKAATWMIPLVS